MKVTLKFDRETKNTFVFKDETLGSLIPTLYVGKSGFDNEKAPASIEVTIKSSK